MCWMLRTILLRAVGKPPRPARPARPLQGLAGLCYHQGRIVGRGGTGMEHKQQLELAQVLKLSPTLLQSMGIL